MGIQEEQPKMEKKIILIVDDIELNREILRMSFEAECEILEAVNGEDALVMLEMYPVNLLITDIFMEKMDGYELIQKIRSDKKYKDLAIIAVTEHDEVLQHKVLELGADEFICKPFVDKALHSCVSNILFRDGIRVKLEQFHQVFDKNPIPFMLYQLQKGEDGKYSSYRIAYMNKAANILLDTNPEDVIGKTISDVSQKKLQFLVMANEKNEKQHEIRYDSCCNKYLDITAYRETEGYVAFVMSDLTEQIRQEQVVGQEKDKYSHLLDTIPGGIAVFDLIKGKSVRFNYFNDEICEMTGYTREEILERGTEKLCEAICEDLEDTVAACQKAVTATSPVIVEYRTLTKNQEIRYIRAKLTIEEVEKDNLIAYIAYTDITMQKQAEQALTMEMRYLEAAQDKDLLAKCRANVTQNIVDNYISDGRLVTIPDNPKYSDTVMNIVNLCATEEMAEDFENKMLPEKLVRVFEKNIHELQIEYLRRMSDGTNLWVLTVAKLYADPETRDVMCFMYTYDIDKEKTMQLIVDHVTQTEFDMMGLIHLRNRQLTCIRASEMERQLKIGVNVDYTIGVNEYIQRYILDEFKDESLKKMSLAGIQEELGKKKAYTLTYPVLFEGKKLHKKWEYSYLDESHETIIFTRADMTELLEEQERQRENLRNALLQAEQASHAKTDFLSHMSHEIRTPMNAIIGMSTLAAQCVHDPKQVAECISKVGISARFLLSLINDILDMSRIESGKVTLKKEKFCFEELIASVNSIIYNQAKEKGVDYECIITSFTGTNYIGDEMKLQQIIINLLGNAVKFTPAGGKTQFIIHQNKVENGKAYFTFTINDTGIGISEQFQQKMFEPFEREEDGTTTVYQGTGLGLAITKNLVDMMGGTISVNSIEGVGSEFAVNLALDACEEELPVKLPEAIPFEKLQALVVDDDVLICEHTQYILREMGMQAEWVSSGKQAVTLVHEKHVKKKDFDIVLLDWQMPEMDGIETARQIRKIVGVDVTIIVITAYDWSSIEAEAKAAGVNLLVTKPLFKSTLMSAFQRVFIDKTQKEEEVKSVEYDFTGRQILLVEDHILNVEVARRLLESKHAQVDVAENGLRAIEKFAKASDDYYDAILMDIRMPVMDGLTSARSIRQLSNASAATVPIIAMSANAFDEDIEKSQAAGMNAHLSKPIEPDMLFATLNRYFHRK